MKRLSLALMLCITLLTAAAQPETYSRARIYCSPDALGRLAALGIDPAECRYTAKAWLESDFSASELRRAAEAGFRTEVLIPDVTAFYADRAARSLADPAQLQGLISAMAETSEWDVPAGFNLGSMGGYATWNEILAELDSMHQMYPGLCTQRAAISDTLSIEGRPIYWVRISDNAAVNEGEPEVLFTGLHHAREPIGAMHALFFMYYLLSNYATDPLVEYIVDNTALYFVPVVNPDGYVYNQSIAPSGGGMWRKNRRNAGGGNYGVDLNRNYGYMWGYDDIGSSPDPFEETYRGTGPFSEPESRNIRAFCNSHSFRTAVNYHAYGDLLLYPWGYDISLLTPDDTAFHILGAEICKSNGYAFGTVPTTIGYSANGGAEDWYYGEQGSKPKIYGFTAEVGDDFWPAPEYIIPNCQANMWTNFAAALCAGHHASLTDKSPPFLPAASGYLRYEIRRLGLENGGAYTVSITPVTGLSSCGGPVTYNNLTFMEARLDSLPCQTVPGIQPGDLIRYALSLSYGGLSFSDTITKVYGLPQLLWQSNCNSLSGWTGGWALSSSQYVSPTASITDSPMGPYSSYANNSTTLSQTINLSGSVAAFLEFEARWQLETDFDYVQVLASTDGGVSWTPHTGQHTTEGSAYQDPGQPVYDGNQPEWVHEVIDLDAFCGNTLRLRFTLRSDGWQQLDGFYFDDIRVVAINPLGTPPDLQAPGRCSAPYPNPAEGQVTIEYELQDDAVLEICDMLGHRLHAQPIPSGKGIASADISDLAPGMYIYGMKGSRGLIRSGSLCILP